MERKHNSAKRYLMQLRIKRQYIERLKAQRTAIEADISLLRGIRYDTDRVQTSPDGEGFPRGVVELMEIETEIADRIVEYEMFLSHTIAQIHSLSRKEYADVLYKIYVQGKSLGQAADEIGYEYVWMCKVHGRALEEFRIRYMQQDN